MSDRSSVIGFNYAVVLCDSNTRYPFAILLRSLSAKNVYQASFFSNDGNSIDYPVRMWFRFYEPTDHYLSEIFACNPNFNVPGRPQQTGLRERLIGTLMNMISKVAVDQPRSWHKHLEFILWALRECPNSTLGVHPFFLVYGRLLLLY